jgi:hypothetical protein
LRSFRASVLTYRDVEKAASNLLQELGRLDSVPVEVEDIVEFEMGLEVRPVLELQRRFVLDGFLGNRSKTVFVDQWVMEHRPNRYRFTLAHELGHLVLHAEVMREVDIETLEDWHQFHADLGEENRAWFEHQAYWFAGALLVPANTLLMHYEEALRRTSQAGVGPQALSPHIRGTIAGWIGKAYKVSTDVVTRRLKRVVEGW